LTSTVILRDRSPRATAVVTSAMLRTWPVRLLAIALTLSVRSFQVPATPGTTAWRRACPRCRPRGDAGDLRGERAQLLDHRVDRFLELQDLAAHVDGDLLREVTKATAIVTSAMLRTCAVRLPAIWLTDSVRSFHTPETPLTWAWPPSLPSVPTSRATRVTSDVNTES